MDIDPEFDSYFHQTLAPDLMAVAFSLESIRADLELEGHPIEPELKRIEMRISEILTRLRETILNGSEGGSGSP